MSPSGVEYERAFRSWSVPPGVSTESDAPPPGDLSFQVYTPQDIGAGRGPMRTMIPIEASQASRQKPNVALHIGLGVLAASVIGLTALAVIAELSEDPKVPVSRTAAIAVTAEPAPPAPSVIIIGDDPGAATSAVPTAQPTTPPIQPAPSSPALAGGVGGGDEGASAPAHPKPRKPKASSSSSAFVTGSPLEKSGALKPPFAAPPNPYGSK